MTRLEAKITVMHPRCTHSAHASPSAHAYLPYRSLRLSFIDMLSVKSEGRKAWIAFLHEGLHALLPLGSTDQHGERFDERVNRPPMSPLARVSADQMNCGPSTPAFCIAVFKSSLAVQARALARSE
jgi:hypothetical protein